MILKRHIDFINENVDESVPTFTLKLIEPCKNCDETGIEEGADCSECHGGTRVWNIKFIQGLGADNVYEEYGNSDQPIQYDDGRVAWNRPETFPEDIKDIVGYVFNHKDLGIKEIVNSVARYMAIEDYTNKYKFDYDMVELFDEDTKRVLKSKKGIDKYQL